MNTTALSIEDFASRIPPQVGTRSGKVFYSGRRAFSLPSALYVLGINPGGSPENYLTETVASHTHQVLFSHPAEWSAYRDESWELRPPGTYGMAPRVLHLFERLRLEPHAVPCSNVVFVRSRSEADLASELPSLVEVCWPFHQHVIERLAPKVVLCLGSGAGAIVRQRLGAHREVSKFVERNDRRWVSRSYEANRGQRVVVVTHPSRVDWLNPAADPSPLVAAALHDA